MLIGRQHSQEGGLHWKYTSIRRQPPFKDNLYHRGPPFLNNYYLKTTFTRWHPLDENLYKTKPWRLHPTEGDLHLKNPLSKYFYIRSQLPRRWPSPEVEVKWKKTLWLSSEDYLPKKTDSLGLFYSLKLNYKEHIHIGYGKMHFCTVYFNLYLIVIVTHYAF